MKRARWPQWLAAAGLIGGCVAGPAPADPPARIVNAGDASRAELQRAVSDALHVGSVMLADDALTESSILVIERNRIRNMDDAPLSGRDLGTPDRFRLVMQNDRCVLIHERSGRRFELTATDCVAE